MISQELTQYRALRSHFEGKTTRRRPEAYDKIPRVHILPTIFEHRRDEEIEMDFLFIKGNSFFHTKSRVIKLLSIQSCASRERQIVHGLDIVNKHFTQQGFNVVGYAGDNASECI